MTLTPLAGRRLAPGTRSKRNALASDAENQSGRVACFVAGPENELLSAVVNELVDALASSPANSTDEKTTHAFTCPSPLILSGPNGSGKTHLAHGLAELWIARRGDAEAAYYTAGDFSRAYAAAIADQNVRDFRRQLRRKRLLVIDDVHRLGESTHNAQELRHTLDAISERGGLVLLTTNTSLADCSEFGRPLLSRFAGGLTLPIAPPGAAARRELLHQAADAAGCKLDEDALSTLANGLPAEAPKVLRAAAELRRRSGIRVDGAAAERFVESEQSTSSPPLREILRVVARYHQVPLRVLTSASRKQGVVAARAVAIFLARQLTPLSYAEIGQMLGGRDHTTIMHNYRRIDRELPKDRALQSAVDDLRRLLAP